MLTNLVAWFQSSDWLTILDSVVIAVLARYIPSATPIYTTVKGWLTKLFK